MVWKIKNYGLKFIQCYDEREWQDVIQSARLHGDVTRVTSLKYATLFGDKKSDTIILHIIMKMQLTSGRLFLDV